MKGENILLASVKMCFQIIPSTIGMTQKLFTRNVSKVSKRMFEKKKFS